MASDEKKPAFTVTDRRSFAGGDEVAKPAPAASAHSPAAPPPAARPEEADGGDELPEVDFPTFVISLGSSALLHLGEIEHPATGQKETNLPVARHTIEVLAMLQDKTRGNLSADESALMEQLLYDLRLRYVAAARGSG